MRNPFAPLFQQKSIGSSYELARYLLKGVQSTAGPSVSEATALNIAAVMTCVSLRSRALASLPLKLYERIDERSKKPAVHSLNRVLSQPNSWQTRSELLGMLEAHRVLRGNAYAWKNIVRLGNGPDGRFEQNQLRELIPMHPDQVEIVDDFDEFGAPRIYRLHRRKAPPVDLPATEVVHIKGLSTDGRKGRAVLEDAREMLGIAIATQDHAGRFWSNDATPMVALTHPARLSDKARKNIEESWEEIYGRSKDKRRAAVLEEGVTIQQLTLSEKDNQFLETRHFQRSEIASWFHVPPHMIGDTQKSTSWGTGIEQQQIGFMVFTLRPDLVLWEQRLTRDLLSDDDQKRFFFEFNLDGWMRGDVAARGMFYTQMLDRGVFCINDVLGLENKNPVPDGETRLVMSNMVPLDKAGQMADAQIASMTAPPASPSSASGKDKP